MTHMPPRESGTQPQTGHQPWCDDWRQRCPACQEIARRYYPQTIGASTPQNNVGNIGADIAHAFGSQPVMTFTEQATITTWLMVLVAAVAAAPFFFIAYAVGEVTGSVDAGCWTAVGLYVAAFLGWLWWREHRKAPGQR